MGVAVLGAHLEPGAGAIVQRSQMTDEGYLGDTTGRGTGREVFGFCPSLGMGQRREAAFGLLGAVSRALSPVQGDFLEGAGGGASTPVRPAVLSSS